MKSKEWEAITSKGVEIVPINTVVGDSFYFYTWYSTCYWRNVKSWICLIWFKLLADKLERLVYGSMGIQEASKIKVQRPLISKKKNSSQQKVGWSIQDRAFFLFCNFLQRWAILCQ